MILNLLRGFLIGVTDLIPGVSGGTTALILGIYPRMIQQVTLIDGNLLNKALSRDFNGVKNHLQWSFLWHLFLGLVLGILTLSRALPWIFQNYPHEVWSLFFGLMSASVLLLWRRLSLPLIPRFALFMLGTSAAWLIVGWMPVQTPQHFAMYFLAGVLSISAMILPGLSGAFVLLLLGQYEVFLLALKQLDAASLMTLFFFASGMLVGLMSTSRVIYYFYQKAPQVMISLMIGFIAGSLRKIWPWRQPLDVQVIGGKVRVLSEQNLIPDFSQGQTHLCLFIILISSVLLVLIESRARA